MKRVTIKNESGAIVAQMDLEDAEAEQQLVRAGAPDSSFRKFGNISVFVESLEATPAYRLSACRALRHANYPSIGDQLDALYKARHGDASALEALDARIAEVKASFPKPA